MRVFEIETARTNLEGGIVPKLAEKALGVPRLSACAGIAMVKLHFPFSVAYELAEALMQVAKTVKNHILHPDKKTPYPCSALDFHVLYDSSDVDLSLIRHKLQPEPPEQTHLYNRPFVITPLEDLETSNNPDWAKFHHWHNLLEQVEILTAKNPQDPGKRSFPNSQAHTLRQELFRGRKAANGYYNLIRERYPEANIKNLGIAASSDSLFAEDPNSKIWVTALIDAIDAADFLQTAPETVPESAAR